MTNNDSRFKVVVAGRRFGKTHLALYSAFLKALSRKDQKIWFIAPTYRQAKNIAWTVLKKIVFDESRFVKKTNESELSIIFFNDSKIELKGADNEDSLRGVGLDYIVLDEFAFMKKEAWTEVLRPALSDKKGSAMFIGTPDGFNYFYDLFQKGRNGEDGFKSWFFKSIDSPFLDKAEIEAARKELDERTFRQEYEASFETASGRIYYSFNRDINKTELGYNPDYELKLCLDFNVNPCIWEFAQTIKGQDFIIDELARQNTNTEDMAKAVGDRYGYDKPIIIYGDYSGTFRATNTLTTDYQIIKQILPNVTIKVKPNPPVIDRVNAVNSRLKNAAGENNLFINIKKCPQLVKDLEQVIWKEDRREIDKSNSERTHASDALGYYIEFEYSIKGKPQITHKFS